MCSSSLGGIQNTNPKWALFFHNLGDPPINWVPIYWAFGNTGLLELYSSRIHNYYSRKLPLIFTYRECHILLIPKLTLMHALKFYNCPVQQHSFMVIYGFVFKTSVVYIEVYWRKMIINSTLASWLRTWNFHLRFLHSLIVSGKVLIQFPKSWKQQINYVGECHKVFCIKSNWNHNMKCY